MILYYFILRSVNRRRGHAYDTLVVGQKKTKTTAILTRLALLSLLVLASPEANHLNVSSLQIVKAAV